MHRARPQTDEEKLVVEGQLKFRGIARVKLQVLHFPWSDLRDLDKKKVELLKSHFRNHECRRLEPQNHVLAVISEEELKAAIERSPNVEEETLLGREAAHSELVFPADYRLRCLHGFHRIQA